MSEIIEAVYAKQHDERTHKAADCRENEQNVPLAPGQREVNRNRLRELAQPKDKWKVAKTLLELKKEFPLDGVLKRMTKEELKKNRVLRYPEEYQVYDEEEEAQRKLKETTKQVKLTPTEMAEQKKQKQEQRRKQIDQLKSASLSRPQEEREALKQKRADQGLIGRRVNDAILSYIQTKGKRLVESTGTLRNHIAELFETLHEEFPNEMGRLFPADQHCAAKRYTHDFKAYFLTELRQYVRNSAGRYVKARKSSLPFWLPSSHPCRPNDKAITIAESTGRSTNAKAKDNAKHRGKAQGRKSRGDEFALDIWAKQDTTTREKRKQLLTNLSDVENCLFRPNITPIPVPGEPQRKYEDIDPTVY
jgi:hypothetical protein